jgi:hypothetical protein
MTDEEDLPDFENKMRALEEAIKRDEGAFYGERTIKEAYNPKNLVHWRIPMALLK